VVIRNQVILELICGLEGSKTRDEVDLEILITFVVSPPRTKDISELEYELDSFLGCLYSDIIEHIMSALFGFEV
jgi:hypothetical protein